PQAELSAMEQQMLRDMRAELASMQQANSRATLPPTQLVGMRPQEVTDQIDESYKRQFDSIVNMNNYLVGLKNSTDKRLDAFARQIDALNTIVNTLLAQQQVGR